MKEYIGILGGFFDRMCTTSTTLLVAWAFQIMHFLFVSSINAYKCHIINFLLTSLARSLQRNIGPRFFLQTNLALRNKPLEPGYLRARSVQKRPRSDISLYRPRVLLIRS